jgi:undecaprenyl-diphosphatase
LPITCGAVLFEARKAMTEGGGFAAMGAAPGTILLGVLVSFLSGFWAISFLLHFLKKHDVSLFVAWRIAVGLAVLALIASGRPG